MSIKKKSVKPRNNNVITPTIDAYSLLRVNLELVIPIKLILGTTHSNKTEKRLIAEAITGLPKSQIIKGIKDFSFLAGNRTQNWPQEKTPRDCRIH